MDTLLILNQQLKQQDFHENISKIQSYFKPSKYRNFLLFYVVLVLVDILPMEQLVHFFLLSYSIYKLLQYDISNEHLKTVEKIILKFCQQFQEIYRKHYMLADIHQLLHLRDNVKHLGPYGLTHAFHLKIKTFILQLIHGSQKIECQLNSAINVIQSIPNPVEKTISKDSLLMSFYQSMNRQKCFRASEPIAADTFILGKAI